MLHSTKLLLDRLDAFQRAGKWKLAIELCEGFFQESCRARRAEDVLEAILRLGLLYCSKGDRGLAEEYFQLAIAIGEQSRDFHRVARAQNGLGVLHHWAGDTATAEKIYLDAMQKAELAEDRLTIGDLQLNLGILANIRGDLTEALRYYRTALYQYETVANRHRVARVLNNLGMLHIDIGDYSSASKALDRALGICQTIGDVVTEGIVHSNRAELFLARGDLDAARASCDEAFEISSRLGDHSLKAEVLKGYGLVYRQIDKPHLAEAHLLQAIGLACDNSLPLIEAEASRELALILRLQDRNKEALTLLNRAHTLFVGLQAKHDQADIDKKLAQLQTDFLTLVARWGESIEAKDRYTSGHCQRVADYACKIAARAGIPEREMIWFRMGAFLHDVGKTEVPADILNKPGKLTEDERAIIERHTIVGDEMLASIDFPWDVRPMVRSHHERWDGRGYPDRLSGEAIPLTARILHIADVFDALTTNRSYREPLTSIQALQIMEDDVGSFDPCLFNIFRELLPSLITQEDQAEGAAALSR